MSYTQNHFNAEIIELENDPRSLKIDQLMDKLAYWGKLVVRLRSDQSDFSKEEMISSAIRLSKILTILITEFGICSEFAPLPEMVSALRNGKRFDITEAESVTALVYCTHKVIECLAITLASVKEQA